MYSLVSASVLGFDLVRHENGDRVAGLLLRGLTLAAADLDRIADAYVVRDDRPAEPGPPTAGHGALTAALRASGPLVATDRPDEAARLLAAAPLGDLDDLLRLVRREVFDWAWQREVVPLEAAARAVDVFCDAVQAAHADRRDEALAGPWREAERRLEPRPVLFGPAHDQVSTLLTRLERLTRADLDDLQQAVVELRARGSWPSAMHAATWAVHLSGRVREAAAAQLCAVRALRGAGVDAVEAAAGLWNLVSGALQATVVTDLLARTTERHLRGPLATVLSNDAPGA